MATKKVLSKEEVKGFISIGFCHPKFYKRSAWLKAKAIMDRLVSLNVGVIEYDYGRGKGKYSLSDRHARINYDYLAEKYMESL